MSLIIGSTLNNALPSALVKNAAFVTFVDDQDTQTGQVGERVNINTENDERVLRDAAQAIQDGRVTDLDRLPRQSGSPRTDTVTISQKPAPRIVSQALENHLKFGRSQEIDAECQTFVDVYIRSIAAQYESAKDTASLDIEAVNQTAKQTAIDYLEQLRLAQQ